VNEDDYDVCVHEMYAYKMHVPDPKADGCYLCHGYDCDDLRN